jgi:hypothetical protein
MSIPEKKELLPFNPASPDVQVVGEPLARALRAALGKKLDAVVQQPLNLPRPMKLTWAGESFDCVDTTWSTVGGSIEVALRQPIGSDTRLERLFGMMNEPATFELEGGGTLQAKLAHLTGRGHAVNIQRKTATATFTLLLDGWTWLPPSDVSIWVGRLEGTRRIDDGNLAICSDGGWSGRNLFLAGKYDLCVISSGATGASILTVSTHGQPLDHATFGTDFMAMEFVLGRPLGLEQLIAVNADLEAVGAMGFGYGAAVEKGRPGRSPVAQRQDLFANFEETDAEHFYLPVLFGLISESFHREGPDAAVVTAVSAYLDSVISNVHVAYLLAQVALEALASAMVPATQSVLVTNSGEWLAFVERHEDEIRALARSPTESSKLLNKVRSAQQAPSTDRVVAALLHCKLDVPDAAKKEISRRNASAHRYVMAPESTADAEELADRLATVQTLLVALIAEHVGFTGPILGWEWIRGRHKIPSWWPWERSAQARRRYLVVPETSEAI